MKERFGRTISGFLVAEVEISGPLDRTTIHMAVDTGATRTIIDTFWLRYVGLDPAKIGFRPTSLATPNGMAYAHLVGLDSLRCLGRKRAMLEVAARDLPPNLLIDGLLGLDFLGSGKLELDFAAGTISLS